MSGNFLLITLAGLLVLAPPGALAQSESEPPIRLVCGGVGLEESEPMRGEATAHSLTLLFATPQGAYLAGVETRVEDPLADIRVEQSCGPLGLVDVAAPGRYRLVASFRGETQEQWLDLAPGGAARLVLRWAE